MKALLYLTIVVLHSLGLAKVSFAQSCTISEKTPRSCACNNGTYTIYDYTYRDLQHRVCRTSSDPCTCPAPGNGFNATIVPNTSSGPSGSYLNSCRNCHLHGNTLTCASCKDRHGSWETNVSLDISTCGGGIENVNGRLMCPGRPEPVSAAPPPIGGNIDWSTVRPNGREGMGRTR